MEKSLITIVVVMSFAALATCVAAVYLSVSIGNMGNIVAHGCKVYLDDKTTESYTINWGQIAVNQTVTNYRWIYNNGTYADTTYLSWRHDAESYLSVKVYYELPDHTWQELAQGGKILFNKGTWLHTKIQLTTLPTAIDHLGSFGFNIFIELS